MAERPDAKLAKENKPTTDSIPVDDLIRLTRELTQRITNMDRQRLALELKESKPTLKSKAPVVLQQFFSGEVDLDTELSKRYANAPLLSDISLKPKRPAAILPSHRAIAIGTSQDGGAQLTFNMDIETGVLEITFTTGNMLSFTFDIGAMTKKEREDWLDLMRRQSGIAFMWTDSRWEEDYIIFVVRDSFARVYAFSPRRYEASVRLTPNVLVELLDWLEAFWFPDLRVEFAPPPIPVDKRIAGANVSGNYVTPPAMTSPKRETKEISALPKTAVLPPMPPVPPSALTPPPPLSSAPSTPPATPPSVSAPPPSTPPHEPPPEGESDLTDIAW